MDKLIEEFINDFGFKEQETKEVIEILIERNIPLEKCYKYWEENCFRFESLEDIEIENTDFCSVQDLLDNESFRKNNYILTSGLLVSIG